ncbi:chorismate synthase [Endomicrobium proavitum]|uniref:Chorismate synthase n=1 Tax=Endomicrobium proavitum TaxID=1408281 RepID=A0A0G3WFG5_9BACT|nr:chorismate synthase [Endomicrobium proavitum]AKL97401.1 Chorismate synthase [Endomicrobium proavitum]
MIRFTTAGESHGRGIIAILEGIPAGLNVNSEDIDVELARRQKGYGRGARMRIETDVVKVLSGMRYARTIGSPIALYVTNRDWENWENIMSPIAVDLDGEILLKPRPGHADLAGLMKYGSTDFRDILERASARETAARVAVGAVCKELLKEFDIRITSYTLQIGNVTADINSVPAEKIWHNTEMSYVRCPDAAASKKMIQLIKKTGSQGDTLGGKLAVKIENVPAGLGSHTQWDLKLDGRLAQSFLSIQAIKAVEFGSGSKLAAIPGSLSHDEIFYNDKKGFYRNTNRAGGIEGGMSNGETIEISCTMKAIPSLAKPLRSVNLSTKKAAKAEAVRSDVCAVPAAGIVAEAVAAFEIAKALKEKFGGDNIEDMKKSVAAYKARLKNI